VKTTLPSVMTILHSVKANLHSVYTLCIRCRGTCVRS
jgi:hypothetical protein